MTYISPVKPWDHQSRAAEMRERAALEVAVNQLEEVDLADLIHRLPLSTATVDTGDGGGDG